MLDKTNHRQRIDRHISQMVDSGQLVDSGTNGVVDMVDERVGVPTIEQLTVDTQERQAVLTRESDSEVDGVSVGRHAIACHHLYSVRVEALGIAHRLLLIALLISQRRQYRCVGRKLDIVVESERIETVDKHSVKHDRLKQSVV